jgi:hypothetical protein
MKSCPQFSQGIFKPDVPPISTVQLMLYKGCPFKTVCSDGSLLITALQAHRWDMIFSESDFQNLVETEAGEDLDEP